MRTQYYMAASLHGFIATPDDSLEWLFPLGDIEATGFASFIRDVGALAMGFATYEWMLRHAVGAEGCTARAMAVYPAGVGTSPGWNSVQGGRDDIIPGCVPM